MHPTQLASVAIPDVVQIGVAWMYRRVEFLAFWSAILLLGAYPAILSLSESVSGSDIGLLLAIHAACLLVGHGYGSSVAHAPDGSRNDSRTHES